MPNRSATASVSSYGNPMEIPEPLISWPFRNVWDWILDCEQHKNITPNWIVHSSLWQTCRCLRLPIHTYIYIYIYIHILYNILSICIELYRLIYIYIHIWITDPVGYPPRCGFSGIQVHISFASSEVRIRCKSERLGSPKPWRLQRVFLGWMICEKRWRNGVLVYFVCSDQLKARAYCVFFSSGL